jgi:hypothetical protein
MRFVLVFLFCNTLNIFSQTVGTVQFDEGTEDGYFLLNPQAFDTTYLLDNCGRVVNKWPCQYTNGMYAFITPNGTLLKSAIDPNSTHFVAGGATGIILEYDWNGNVIWEYSISDFTKRLHHDMEVLPNGNILAIAWEKWSAAESIQAGRDPNKLPSNEVWTTVVYEIQPIYPNSATIVWEWHAWDHLIQDFDSQVDNYGNVANDFRKLDINKGNPTGHADWAHVNGIHYNEELDQIVLSSPQFNELWIIDHSTSTAEAATSSGGNSGKGGDLLWRWGNPASYNNGTSADQQLFFQHNSEWVENGTRFINQISVFSNRDSINGALGSKVKIIDAVFDTVNNEYPMAAGKFLPYSPTYELDLEDTLLSPRLSGVQVLPNENLLICSGSNGHIVEIDSTENVVWQYVVPINQAGAIVTQGSSLPHPKNLFTVKKYPYDYVGFSNYNLNSALPIELSPNVCISLSVLEGESFKNSIQVFPNPSNEQFTIRFSGYMDWVYIYNSLGQLVFQEFMDGELTVDCFTWNSGLYRLMTKNQALNISVQNGQ